MGPENATEYTRVKCPSCRQIVLVPWGHFDATHICTIICPYCQWQMQPIPTDPSTANVRLVPQSGVDMMMEQNFRRFFYYCPNSQCYYIQTNGVAYMQRRVLTELQVGR